MQDIFVEYMVKRKTTSKILLAKAGCVAGALVLWAAIFLFLMSGPYSTVGALAAMGVMYGGFYLMTSLNVEYEYSVTNGEIDVDKIIARRRRRRIITLNCREVEAFGRYLARDHAAGDYQARIFACDSPGSENLWYCASRLGDKGLTLVVFNANDKMLGAIKPFLPRPIAHEAFKTGAVRS